MRNWWLCLILFSTLSSSAQINYSSLHAKNDSLYSYLGRLYTGNAIFKQTYYPYKIQITFGLKQGKIVCHTIQYSNAEHELVCASYDNETHTGISKKYTYDGTLISNMTYSNESPCRKYYVHPDGGLREWDTALVNGVFLSQEFFRNGVIKTDDTILKRMICRQEYDSLGNPIFSKNIRDQVLDRLFGPPPPFGFKWYGDYELVLNPGRGDSVNYGIEVRLNKYGALIKVDAWALHVFVLRTDYRCPYTNRLSKLELFKGETCHFKRWNVSNLLIRSVTISKKRYNNLSPSERKDLNNKVYFGYESF